ncbi:MAG: ADP-ribosylglycohydrolase family protein [Deltaproteobacteria bacterium]|nr:MAG: ADP-ribosylglycohydrolase family protein [Deltaproteobacteria bacterium]
MTDIEAKYVGGMVGSALGDAIGEFAFHYPNREGLRAQLDRMREFRYTDDTAMSIGLAESILKKGCLDQQDLGETFRFNFQKEPWRGYASGPPTIFSMVKRLGMTYAEAARSLFGGAGSFGNGAAMRIVPVGLFFHNSPDLYEKACISASVTHAHPLGKDGAAAQARAVSLALKLDPKDAFPRKIFMDRLLDFARTREMKQKIYLVQELIKAQAPPSFAVEQLGCTVAVHESLPFALYCFLRHLKSFEDCLYCAVLHGGDRDTLGAMVGAVSGVYLGIESIPESWRQKLENRAYIEDLALGLSEIKPRVSFI